MEKKRLILCDTDVVLRIYHDLPETVVEADRIGFSRLIVSSVTVSEIYHGMRKNERRETLALIRRFKTVHIDKQISQRSVEYKFEYLNRMSVADAIIGATATTYDLTLWTYNRQDFDFLPGIRLHNPA